MRTISRFSTGFANFATLTRLAMGLSMGVLSSCAVDAPPSVDTSATQADDDSTAPVCSGGRVHCFAHVKTTKAGAIKAFAAPTGFGPADLQSAYKITTTITTTPTVAIVDAFGYTALESDLAAYRTQYGLPPCTKANGCLKVVNQTGGATLPANPPANDDWTVETALDVDMVSAACPSCKILVVQADNDQGNGLDLAQATAVSLGATVISNSWGGPESAANPATASEQYFNHPGVAIFVSAGDSGYDDAGQGPDYPATSAHVIAVGGTALVKDASARGWHETAWTSGGSGCSLSVPKPAYQTNTGCTYKSTTDIAAVGDPATGLAVYNAGSGGFIVVGGTSASSPMVAALFASTGHGSLSDGTFIMQNAANFNDVTSGTNGTCPAGMTILCTAGTGWDGPTGYGTPNGDFLKGTGGGTTGGPTLSFAQPSDGAHVQLGFQVIAQVGTGATSVELLIDGTMIDTLTTAPFQFSTPTTLSNGSHVVELIALDAAGNETSQSVNVTVGAAGGGSGTAGGGDNSNDVMGGCSAAGGGAGSGVAFIGLAIAFGIRRRRR